MTQLLGDCKRKISFKLSQGIYFLLDSIHYQELRLHKFRYRAGYRRLQCKYVHQYRVEVGKLRNL